MRINIDANKLNLIICEALDKLGTDTDTFGVVDDLGTVEGYTVAVAVSRRYANIRPGCCCVTRGGEQTPIDKNVLAPPATKASVEEVQTAVLIALTKFVERTGGRYMTYPNTQILKELEAAAGVKVATSVRKRRAFLKQFNKETK